MMKALTKYQISTKTLKCKKYKKKKNRLPNINITVIKNIPLFILRSVNMYSHLVQRTTGLFHEHENNKTIICVTSIYFIVQTVMQHNRIKSIVDITRSDTCYLQALFEPAPELLMACFCLSARARQ